MKIFLFILILPLILFADPVPELDYYYEKNQKIQLGISGGLMENALYFGAEVLFPLGNFNIRPSFNISAKDDNNISWYYPACDFIAVIYGNNRKSMRSYLGAGAHFGIPTDKNSTDIDYNIGGQLFLGFDYTLSHSTTIFLELGAQGSSYETNNISEEHIGFLGKLGLRFKL